MNPPTAARPDRKIFPTHAMSKHPEVVAAMLSINKQHADFLTQVGDLSEKYTGARGHGFFAGKPLERFDMVGIMEGAFDVSVLPGRWKEPNGHGTMIPYANNPAAKEIAGATYLAATIPGRGWTVGSRNMIWGDHYIDPGHAFEHEGTVYSHIPFATRFLPPEHQAAMEQYEWCAVPAAAYMDAKNAAA